MHELPLSLLQYACSTLVSHAVQWTESSRLTLSECTACCRPHSAAPCTQQLAASPRRRVHGWRPGSSLWGQHDPAGTRPCRHQQG